MKAGAEIHFLAGQVFTLGVAALAIGPRMPFDKSTTGIGGRLSFPFRRALLGLVGLGMIRVLICHILFPEILPETVDAVLGSIHVIGQSFLCLTTAYLLQEQLSSVINLTPGKSLLTILLGVTTLTVSAAVLGRTVHPNWLCLEHLGEALSCYGVLQTLQTYSRITAPNSHNGCGPFITQLVRWTEYWFLTTSLLAFVGEAAHGYLFVRFHTVQEEHPIVVLLEACRQNQDSGIDDWTRLLIHSIFLNSLDEMQHFTGGIHSSSNGGHQPTTSTEGDDDEETPLVEIPEGQDQLVTISNNKPLRFRHHG